MWQIQGLTKSFGARTLFRDVSWSISPGERIGLVGPNGTGKTTLLRILSGREVADAGDVTAPKDLQVGYLAQDVRVEARGTVLEHAMSGAKDAMAAKHALERATQNLERAGGDTLDAATHAQADALERYARSGGYDLEARAKGILVGLGFSSAQLAADLETLSGGWAMRAELARLLLARPGLLLLDEPTNHLDIESIDWLEQFLDDYDGTWVVVSHDRYFLNRMVDRVAELSARGLLVFEGDYDAYLASRRELDERLEAEAAQRDKRIAEVERFVERFRAKASKARQAQSRVKLLERMKQRAESAPQARGEHPGIHLSLPTPPRSGDTVLEIENLSKRYGTHTVYDRLDFTLRRGDKVALVGPNGAGKSTLLKIIAGEIEPTAGECRIGHAVSRYYFAQHQSDLLEPDATPLSVLRDAMPLESESRVRGILGAFLFRGDDVEKPIRVLSGGEKARVVLARMLAQPQNLLLLDEPTNHLDLQARSVLEEALRAFAGSVVIVSHDRYFINRVATRIVEIAPGGRATSYLGDYDYYAWKKAEIVADEPSPSVDAPDARSPTRESESNDYETRKQRKREREKAERDLAKLEGEIARVEARIAEIDAEMCDEAVFTDPNRVAALGEERESTDAKLLGLYEDWERARNVLDSA